MKLVKGPVFISPPASGWVTVYDATSDEQDLDELHRLAMALSRGLRTAVFTFLVHDSDVLMYLLFENGQLADEYNSVPDYFGEAGEADEERYRGDPSVVLRHCRAGTTAADVERVLHGDADADFAEEGLGQLAALLGIDPARASIGFNYFVEGADDGSVADAKAYLSLP
jgi:hypothetical protein